MKVLNKYMRTLFASIGVLMLIMAGSIGFLLNSGQEQLGAARESNLFKIDDNGYVITQSQISGKDLSNPTDGAAATSTGGTLLADTYYFVITSLDDDGGQTLPSSEFTCSVGTEMSGTSTACTVTLTPNTLAASTRLWVSTVSGTYTGYFAATSSVFVATTTGLTTATLPTTVNTAFNDINVEQKFSYYSTSTAGTYAIKTRAGVLHAITINTDAAGALVIYDGTTCAGTKIGTLEASAPHGTYLYDVAFSNGLCITGAADTDITVSYH